MQELSELCNLLALALNVAMLAEEGSCSMVYTGSPIGVNDSTYPRCTPGIPRLRIVAQLASRFSRYQSALSST